MKRMVSMAIALTLAAGFTLAQTSVTSENIVGYSTLNVHPGLTMVGASFQNVGEDGLIHIQDLVIPEELVGYDYGNVQPGDKLYIWDPTSQGYSEIYAWSGEGYTGLVDPNVWMDDSTFTEVDKSYPVGTAFWIESSIAATTNALVMGEVASQGAGTNRTIHAGLTMLANPYPYPLDINLDAVFTGLNGYDYGNVQPGDKLYIWDPTSQGYSEIYAWSGEGYTGLVDPNVWMDDSTFTEVVGVKIPIGGAFWVESSTGGTVDFLAP